MTISLQCAFWARPPAGSSIEPLPDGRVSFLVGSVGKQARVKKTSILATLTDKNGHRVEVPLQKFEDMNSAQHGRCAICGRRPGQRRLSIDHCHRTGAIRGLLCGACNTGLGCFRDNPNTLLKALAYVCDAARRHQPDCFVDPNTGNGFNAKTKANDATPVGEGPPVF